MNIQIHSLQFDADQKLLDFIGQKIDNLTQISDDIVSVEVFLRLENDFGGQNKVSEVKLEYPGGPIFAKKQSKTFEEATDQVIEALKKHITNKKEKMRGK